MKLQTRIIKNSSKKTTEEKLKEAEDKLLRSLAKSKIKDEDLKEIKDAFEFGSFNLCKRKFSNFR